MKNYGLLLFSILLFSCGGDGGDESDVPNNSAVTNNHNCDENQQVTEAETEGVEPTEDSDKVAEDFTPGIINPAVSKAVAYLQFKGYAVKKVASYQNGKISIDINTCGGDANININSGNSVAAPVTE